MLYLHADHQWFKIHDDIVIRGGKLEIPAFTSGKNNYKLMGRSKTCNFDNYLARIHVERMTGQLRKIYSFAGPLPII